MYRINIVDDQRKKIEWIAEKDVNGKKIEKLMDADKVYVLCCDDAVSNTFAILL